MIAELKHSVETYQIVFLRADCLHLASLARPGLVKCLFQKNACLLISMYICCKLDCFQVQSVLQNLPPPNFPVTMKTEKIPEPWTLLFFFGFLDMKVRRWQVYRNTLYIRVSHKSTKFSLRLLPVFSYIKKKTIYSYADGFQTAKGLESLNKHKQSCFSGCAQTFPNATAKNLPNTVPKKRKK